MRKIICDRCGADISDYDNTGYLAARWRPVRYGENDVASDNPYEDCDFCENCMRQIVAFIDQKVEPEEELEEEPEEEPDQDPEEEEAVEHPAEEPPVKEEYKGVNLRKLRELVKAGKSDKQIAEELGCSLYMYKKHRKRAEELWKAGFL